MQTYTPTNSSNIRFSEHAFWALKTGFVLAPILAGVDKFFNYMTDWTQYLAPIVPNLLGVTPETFMTGVGVIEIVAGIGVLVKPKIFANVVAFWIAGIIFNLLLLGKFYDIALRDLGLCIGAIALGQLAVMHERVVRKDKPVVTGHRHHHQVAA